MKDIFKSYMKIFNKLAPDKQMGAYQIYSKETLRSFSKLEWSLLVIILLYATAPGAYIESQWIILKYSLGFAAFTFISRYLNSNEEWMHWKLIAEIWIMVLYITCVLWYTGKTGSPLVSLYLLVIITSGMTLGKLTTLLTLGLISILYIFIGLPTLPSGSLTLEHFSHMMKTSCPYLIVAYMITVLSSDLQLAKKVFKHLSETDGMTGLMNRRSFDSVMMSEHSRSARYGNIYSILMIDADGLKLINDEHGHATGDKLIKTLAKTIDSCLREVDSLARYGGDEFVVLLPETNKQQAKDAGEKIRGTVENASFYMADNLIKTTVSIGIGTYPEHGESALAMADEALYKSKHGGRNKVCTPDSELIQNDQSKI